MAVRRTASLCLPMTDKSILFSKKTDARIESAHDDEWFRQKPEKTPVF
jgi:hypothetical protein